MKKITRISITKLFKEALLREAALNGLDFKAPRNFMRLWQMILLIRDCIYSQLKTQKTCEISGLGVFRIVASSKDNPRLIFIPDEKLIKALND